jgi:endonuclease/exonuclease/phosphatase family metal-dependent hydrolase
VDLRILAGDINEWRQGGRVLRTVHRIVGTGPRRRTFPSNLPAIALDRIYVAPGHALADLRTVTTTKARVASDHLPLVCDIML